MTNRSENLELSAGLGGASLLFVVCFVPALLVGIAVGVTFGRIVSPPVAPIFGAVPLVWLGWRSASSTFRLTDGTVLIRNIFRTVSRPFSHVEYATSRDLRAFGNAPAVIVLVVRRDGGPELKRVPVAASVQASGARRRQFAAAVRSLFDHDDEFSTYELS